MTTPVNQISQEEAQRIFRYEDGTLYRRSTGRRVGAKLHKGARYPRCMVRGKSIQLHNVIWSYFNNEVPEGYEVDHIDRDPTNNLIGNLRLATRTEQANNRGKFRERTRANSDSISGIAGLGWQEQKKCWGVRGSRYLGSRPDLLSAACLLFRSRICGEDSIGRRAARRPTRAEAERFLLTGKF